MFDTGASAKTASGCDEVCKVLTTIILELTDTMIPYFFLCLWLDKIFVPKPAPPFQPPQPVITDGSAGVILNIVELLELCEDGVAVVWPTVLDYNSAKQMVFEDRIDN